ncbi:manganese efflux pump [uncultured Ilyobacter sp.]|uniref:manganese efflux pump MntP n=1 Tax=uncultured Ilyobacter sp. TaxID=544433 RepID=UPI002AA9445F|nr:manganese efflux pump [uncultured Ilyobacter sp.]
MKLIYLPFIFISLTLDVFTASLTKGFTIEKLKFTDIFKTITVFGVFQIIMFIIGFKARLLFVGKTSVFIHFMFFFILVFLGVRMIFESYRDYKNKETLETKSEFNLILLSFATSIDALIIGASVSLKLNFEIFIITAMIGIITSLASLLGIYLGHKTNYFVNYPVNLAGGFILIFIGVRSLF